MNEELSKIMKDNKKKLVLGRPRRYLQLNMKKCIELTNA